MIDSLEITRVASMVWHWTLHPPEDLPSDATGWATLLERKHGERFPEEIIDAAVVECFRWLGKWSHTPVDNTEEVLTP